MLQVNDVTTRLSRYERLIWSNHLADLYDISRKVETQMQSARQLRLKTKELSRDLREDHARADSAKRRAREQTRLAREARETLEVEAYLQKMIEKLYTYGDSVRLQVYPVSSRGQSRSLRPANRSPNAATSSSPEFLPGSLYETRTASRF